jgi:murein DD-endopeptidase MepM/ murein hydrolase activator NlpD
VPGVALALALTSLALLAVPRTQAAGGGAAAPRTPSIGDVVCQTDCVGLRAPAIGGKVLVSGRNLSAVSKVSFPGGERRVLVNAISTSETVVEARVPRGATDGPLRVRDDYGNVSELSPEALDIRARSELATGGEVRLFEAEAAPRKAYFYGLRRPSLSYIIGSNQPANDIRIDLVRNGEVVRSFFRRGVAPGLTNTLRWDGKTTTGRPAPSGRYIFQVRSANGAVARMSPGAEAALGFSFYRYRFPIVGRHDYGTAINRFGAPRSGHTHQGQDVMAACGVNLVAARGGRVQYAGYQDGGAGFYIVIDGRGTAEDTTYMHMNAPALLRTGQLVRTGQKIGEVGNTGSSSGCHLHFEIWSGPGWYEGGNPYDPLPALQRWDRWS